MRFAAAAQYRIAYGHRRRVMEQPSLLRHLDIDARGLRIGVSHHILDRLDVYALFDHQRPER